MSSVEFTSTILGLHDSYVLNRRSCEAASEARAVRDKVNGRRNGDKPFIQGSRKIRRTKSLVVPRYSTEAEELGVLLRDALSCAAWLRYTEFVLPISVDLRFSDISVCVISPRLDAVIV